MTKIISGIICLVMVASFTVSPLKVSANTTASSNAAQIQMLMQLLTMLQAMLAELQAQNSSNQTTTTDAEVDAEEEFFLDITSPKSGTSVWTEQPLVITWKHENLEGHLLHIYLTGNNVERQVAQSVLVEKGSSKITIPKSDALGVVTAGQYTLSIHITNVKDGSPEALTDSVKINVITDTASVNLQPAVGEDVSELSANIEDSLDFVYYLSYAKGEVEKCVVVANYGGGKDSQVHKWPTTPPVSAYGVVSFNVVAEYPLILLNKVSVTCKNDNGTVVASDAINIHVDNDAMSDYRFKEGETVVESGDGISEAEARSRCLKLYYDNTGVRVRCDWDGQEFWDDTNWKG